MSLFRLFFTKIDSTKKLAIKIDVNPPNHCNKPCQIRNSEFMIIGFSSQVPYVDTKLNDRRIKS